MPDNKDLTGWVDLFETGVHKGKFYSHRDLLNLVRNFYRHRKQVSPPAVIGHSEDQEWLKDTGLPAVGWLAQVRKAGTKVQGRFADMPPYMRRLLEVGAYRRVSPEIYHEDSPPEGIDADGVMFRRIAFLGGEVPHVKSLHDVMELWERDPKAVKGKRHRQALTYSERVPLPGGTWAVFFEVNDMADETDLDTEGGAPDRQGAIDNLLAAGVAQSEIDALAGVDDNVFLSWAVARLAAMQGADVGLEPPPDDTTMLAEFPEGMTREDVVAELVAMGEDPESLEAMDDEALLALYQQLKGTPMSEGKTKTKAKTRQAETFSEARARALERRTREAEARLKTIERLQRERQRQESQAAANAKRANVTSFCESMVKVGKMTPAQAEPGKGPTWLRLMRANAQKTVAKFGEETLTELDMQMREIEASAPVRRYGVEQLADPVKQSEFDDVDKQTDDYVARRNKQQLGAGRN